MKPATIMGVVAAARGVAAAPPVVPPIQNRGVCETLECKAADAQIAASMAPNWKELNPCVDWARYVCGGIMNDTSIPLERDNLGMITANEQEIMREILEGDYPGPEEAEVFQATWAKTSIKIPFDPAADRANFDTLKAMYDECTSHQNNGTDDVIPAATMSLIEEFVHDVYPVTLENAGHTVGTDPKDDSLSRAFEWVARLGVMAFVDLTPTYTPFRTHQNEGGYPMMVRMQPILAEPFMNPSTDGLWRPGVDPIRVATSIVMEVFHPDFSDAEHVHGLARDVARFYHELGESRGSEIMPMARGDNPMPIQDAAGFIPQLDLFRIIMSLAPAGSASPLTNIGMPQPGGILMVSALLARTRREVIQGYIVCQLVQRFAPDWFRLRQETAANGRIRRPMTPMDGILRVSPPMSCAAVVAGRVPKLFARFYIAKTMTPQGFGEANAIVRAVRESFFWQLKTTRWMPPKGREWAMEAIRNVKTYPGFFLAPEYNPFNTDETSKIRQSVDMFEDFDSNEIALARWESVTKWDMMTGDRDVSNTVSPHTINAAFNPSPGRGKPAAVYPAAIMRPPIFRDGAPAYMNWGSFGLIAGHELAHSLDMWANDYLMPLWPVFPGDEYYEMNFKRRQELFVQQALRLARGQYQELVRSVVVNTTAADDDGTLPLEQDPMFMPWGTNRHETYPERIPAQWAVEMMADGEGLDAAYQSWRAYLGSISEKERRQATVALPSIKGLSEDQSFFVAAGSTWCQRVSMNALWSRLGSNDVHPPAGIRNLMIPHTSLAWRRAFKCSPDGVIRMYGPDSEL